MSKETKFTKGEWAINDNGSYFDVGPIDPRYDAIIERTCIGVSHQDEANAHLIKTAPKLYAMLEEVSNLAGSDDQTIADEMVMHFDDIEKLLSEARGE